MTPPHDPEATARPDHRWRALLVLATALSMIVIDGTIVSVALPVIIDDLGLDLIDAQWVNASYAVVFAALLLTTGRLGDRLGRRKMLVIGVLLFTVGSLLAAVAGGAEALIGARVVQGLGGALVLPATLSTVNATFRGKDRVTAFAIWGAVISGMAAVGPLLGGWLTTSFTWPWIFLVNLPIGALVLVGTFLWVPETRAHISEPGLDVVGLLLSAGGFGALVFGLIEGQTLGWWTPDTALSIFGLTWSADAPVSVVPVVLALAVIMLVGFVAWERHRARVGRSALLDLSLFSIPTFRWGNLTAMTVAVGEFGIIFVLPLFLVNVLGLSTMGAGLVLAAMALGAFFSGAMARHLAAAVGAPMVVVIGLLLEVVGVIAVAFTVTPTTSAWLLAALLAVYGLGLGLASAQLTGTTLSEVPAELSGQGSATQSTARQVGSALGTAFVGAALAVGLATAVPAAIDEVADVPAGVSEQLTTATTDSAGSVISELRSEGTDSPAGDATPQVVDALSEGFADATRASLLVAAAFLFLGLAGSGLVVRASRREVVTKP
ncbi:DHA2 family efflux MFS transporter permease subunit [Paraoerskovia marina]|uniref:DHA2 family efflux MFS transporter permease subunit n=1 Tax=Paraoerskovia marina TaxID=545619 RepID=UPI000492C40E|nr:DHA2 family efflux MFS transporter permease subunit [Paraoerskovia marina]